MTAISEMLVNLEDQVRVYRRLLDLSQAQLAALKDHDVHVVHAVLQEVELAMLDRAKVDRTRGELIVRVGVELGVAPEQVTAALLQERAPDAAIAQAIGTCSQELRALIMELDQVVARNRALLEQELALIDHMVKGITTAPEKPTYAADGAHQEGARRKILDMQV